MSAPPVDVFPLGTVTGNFTRGFNGRSLTLTAPFQYRDTEQDITVPIGFVTDFNSVPRGLWNFFPPWEYPEAGVVHDYLYRNPGPRSRGDCDGIHRRIMEAEGASTWLRVSAYLGLRAGGWLPWGKYRQAEATKGYAGSKDAA